MGYGIDLTGIDELWNLHDAYTVQQAAALVAGFDPNMVRWNMTGVAWFENEHGVTESGGTNRVKTALTLLANAINGGTLVATVRRSAWERGWDEEPENGHNFTEEVETFESDMWPGLEIQRVKSRGVIYRVEPDWSLTTITRTNLVEWLYSRGVRGGFFFPDANPDTPGYLDPKNSRYPPKLAAAVRAWEAVTDAKGKSPKQALDKWLREHAADFGLTDDDGNPVKLAIEECSKVANWSNGGAPKTP